MTQDKIILGIDPGTGVTGYGIIKISQGIISLLDYGCIRPSYKMGLYERYLTIFNSIDILLEKFSPHELAIESQFVNKNPQGALKLGMAKGMAIIAAAKKNVPIFEYPPKKVKLAVTGSGRASKEQVQKMVKVILTLSDLPKPQDASDALAIAICHAHVNVKPMMENV